MNKKLTEERDRMQQGNKQFADTQDILMSSIQFMGGVVSVPYQMSLKDYWK